MKIDFFSSWTYLLFISVIASVKGLGQAPELIFADAAVMDRARSDIQSGKSKAVAMLTALRAEADQALAEPPRSVMDKPFLPPSGNKHDYISQGPYWWPDPEKADGLPYIRRDGEVNPEVRKFTDHTYFGLPHPSHIGERTAALSADQSRSAGESITSSGDRRRGLCPETLFENCPEDPQEVCAERGLLGAGLLADRRQRIILWGLFFFGVRRLFYLYKIAK